MLENAVIFAAGMGKRMNVPSKAMQYVCGKPLISYAIDALIYNKIKKIIILYRKNDKEIFRLSSMYDKEDVQFIFIEDYLKKGGVDAHKLFSDIVSYPVITLDCDIIISSLTLKKVIDSLETLFSNEEIKATVTVVDNPLFNELKNLRIMDDIVLEHNVLGFEDGIEGGYIYVWKEPLVSAIDAYYMKSEEYQKSNSFFNYYVTLNKVYAIHVNYLWDVDDMFVLEKTEEILDNYIF